MALSLQSSVSILVNRMRLPYLLALVNDYRVYSLLRLLFAAYEISIQRLVEVPRDLTATILVSEIGGCCFDYCKFHFSPFNSLYHVLIAALCRGQLVFHRRGRPLALSHPAIQHPPPLPVIITIP